MAQTRKQAEWLWWGNEISGMYESLSSLVDLWNEVSIFLKVDYGFELEKKHEFKTFVANIKSESGKNPIVLDPA